MASPRGGAIPRCEDGWMAEPLSGEELERVRDGSVVPEPEPCSGCGAVPEHDDLRRWHWWHEEGCAWAEELQRRRGDWLPPSSGPRSGIAVFSVVQPFEVFAQPSLDALMGRVPNGVVDALSKASDDRSDNP